MYWYVHIKNDVTSFSDTDPFAVGGSEDLFAAVDDEDDDSPFGAAGGLFSGSKKVSSLFDDDDDDDDEVRQFDVNYYHLLV